MKTDRKIAEQHIKDAQEALDKAKKDLAKLDKPKLRFGDYGIDKDGTMLTVGLTLGNNRYKFTVYDETLCPCGYVDGNRVMTRPNIKWLGNIFADLAAISEPLEEFKTLDFNMGKITCKQHRMGLEMVVPSNSTNLYLNMDKLHDFITNLQFPKWEIRS